MTPEQERVYQAGQWQIMWWKFRRHKVAVVATVILAIFYASTLVCEMLAPYNLRLILAHAERYDILIDDLALCAKWIEAGCLFQVTAKALADPWEPGFELALKRWARRIRCDAAAPAPREPRTPRSIRRRRPTSCSRR